ncbi:PTS system mannose/fructose/sorbose family transporter subunit IID [Faecalicoccus pleomorphus]|uniref:PTS system mannose/fructose/sorbose family transporter subunit IID n=1 Tax=Faecalicoccus pleomorphus TaxID=1323 RepID=UPI00232ED4BF|nr:PTS system mannose/fructose/sorbose family transporter subunit IID [Faecalicoccus pleomorphus]MDB7988759.1 PTS system mannose/fructose/sorbose family transporter subunit IID [Faecalicoccus pleomorphus]MDB7993079.1 PTS system mannose/fructose/sorbose family transporter subunit IID [Faecalicoccus pleomorphus]
MNETLNEATVKKQLTKKDLIRCFLIWETTSESCLSYERLMSMGFCHAMTPIINRLYADNKEERIKALRRHMMFFNTENNWGAFIPGLVASMEEDMARRYG